MGLGLGIASLVILVLSVPIPLYGTYINFVALVLAAVSALAGNRVLPIAVVAISAVKLFMMSPTWMLIMASSGKSWAPLFTWVMLGLPLGAMLLQAVMKSEGGASPFIRERVATPAPVQSASPRPSASGQAASAFCDACGAVVEAEDRFCGGCGARVAAP